MEFVDILANVLSTEAYALNEAAKRLDSKVADQLVDLFRDLVQVEGSLVFCGVGKSGLIGQKLAATFTSLGLPSHFLHPTEALHGDLGTLREKDALVLISYSGKSEELVKLIPYLVVPEDRRIALVGDMTSPIAKACSLVFDCHVHKEACLNNQAPTTSSTLALATGDAMAVLYEHVSGLSKEGFAQFHPGGKLGKSLRLKVKDLMIPVGECASLKEGDSFKTAIMKMSEYPLGAAVILGEDHKLKGLVVEGDVRRLLSQESYDLEVDAIKVANKSPITICQEELASVALKTMEERENPFSVLPVLDDNKSFVGLLRLHDLFKEGL